MMKNIIFVLLMSCCIVSVAATKEETGEPGQLWRFAKLVIPFKNAETEIQYVLFTTWTDKPSIILACSKQRYFSRLSVKPVKVRKYLDWDKMRKKGIHDVDDIELLINGELIYTLMSGFDRKNKVLSIYYHDATKGIISAIEQGKSLHLRVVKSGKTVALEYPEYGDKIDRLKAVCG